MIRLGVDFGGSKIEAAAIYANGRFAARKRRPNPGDYQGALRVVAELIDEIETGLGQRFEAVGVGGPGSISPTTGLLRGANSTWLNGKPFAHDMEKALNRRVYLANDADCFALSEALPDHADQVVFGVIIGTGCGGAAVVRGKVNDGCNNIAGEWGHTPLPWPMMDENGAHRCWCGRRDCLETWISGPAFEADYARASGERRRAAEIVALSRKGDALAASALERYMSRLARGLAVVCDIVDPHVIVLGGGMSNIDELYTAEFRDQVAALTFTDAFATQIKRPVHGDSSGVRGAAWLVPE